MSKFNKFKYQGIFTWIVFVKNPAAKVSNAKRKSLFFSTICLREELPLLTFLVLPTFLSSFAFFICLLPSLQSFHSFSLFLLTVKQEKDVLYRLGSTGPQLPNNTLIYQPPPASLHEEAVLQCWLLLTARKAVCISGYTSLGCV